MAPVVRLLLCSAVFFLATLVGWNSLRMDTASGGGITGPETTLLLWLE